MELVTRQDYLLDTVDIVIGIWSSPPQLNPLLGSDDGEPEAHF